MKKIVLLIGLCAFIMSSLSASVTLIQRNQSMIVLSNDDPPQKAETKKAKAETVAPKPIKPCDHPTQGKNTCCDKKDNKTSCNDVHKQKQVEPKITTPEKK